MQTGKVKNKRQYERALQRFEELSSAKAGTKENIEARLVAIAIKKYEDENFKISIPDYKMPGFMVKNYTGGM